MIYLKQIATLAASSQQQQSHPPAGGRARILRAIFELIGRDGIGALSNRRIATEAGVSLGSLTYHFPSQAELLRETLALYVDEEVARMEAIAAGLRARQLGPEEVAEEVQRLAGENAARPDQLAELELFLQAARDPVLHEASRRCFSAYEGVAAAALETLGVPDPGRHARAVVALMTGFGVRRLAAGEENAGGLAEALLTVVEGARARSDLD